MKKILILSLLASVMCFGEESLQEHERKMQQMRNQTGEGSMNQEKKMNKNQHKYQYKNGGENMQNANPPQDGSGNMYKGSRGGGGGRR